MGGETMDERAQTNTVMTERPPEPPLNYYPGAIQAVGGIGAGQLSLRTRPIDHKRRAQLLAVVTEVSKIFEKYEITGDERCLVGQLCQTLLQFRN